MAWVCWWSRPLRVIGYGWAAVRILSLCTRVCDTKRRKMCVQRMRRCGGLKKVRRITGVTQAKRFISGAVCPSCQAVDRIVIEAVTQSLESKSLNDIATEAIRRRCVSCGFTEALDPDQAAVTAPLPRARYEKSRQTTTKVETVKIIDLTGPKSS